MNQRIKILLDYIKEDPEDSFSKYLLALEYIKENNDRDAAVWMEQLYKLNPEYLPNYYHYGKLNERLGNLELSKEIYTKGMMLARSEGNHHTMSELRSALDLLDSD